MAGRDDVLEEVFRRPAFAKRQVAHPRGHLDQAIRILAVRVNELLVGQAVCFEEVHHAQVVKLRPAKPGVKSLKTEKSAELGVQSVPVAIEPDEVTERLPVDPHAARIPILGGLVVEPGPDGMQAEEDDGYDEESIADELKAAISHFRNSDFTRAAKELKRFAQKYPEHFLTADALYYLGHARFAQGYYKDAEVDFSAVSLQHPESKFAAGAMLMAAQCHEKLGRRRNARSVYLQLVLAYPLSEEAAEANRRLQSIQ